MKVLAEKSPDVRNADRPHGTAAVHYRPPSTFMASSLTFKAGGRAKAKRSPPRDVDGGKDDNHGAESPRHSRECPPTSSSATPQSSPSPCSLLSVIRAGAAQKRSPFRIENWIACVLTLDGRDKLTKAAQYAARLLCWYFAGLAAGGAGSGAPSSGATASWLPSLVANLHLRKTLYLALSQRFGALYKSLLFSRKAFRLGRSVIELDKLKSVGLGDCLGYAGCRDKAHGVNMTQEMGKDTKGVSDAASSSDWREAHPISEKKGKRDTGSTDDGSIARGGSEEGSGMSMGRTADPSSRKIANAAYRSGQPKLSPGTTCGDRQKPLTGTPKDCASSNRSSTVGISPIRHPPPPSSANSELSKYHVDGLCQQSKEQLSGRKTLAPSPPLPATSPSWKIIGGSIKLVGLMGFWAFDNLAFLIGSGFLDPIDLRPSVLAAKSTEENLSNSRKKRKRRATEWALRCYFFGTIGGLYVNARAWWSHQNKMRSEARIIRGDNTEDARAQLEQMQRKHVELCLALLKSSCDFVVFSNNPGVDLHLKYRGKKNHEGWHCVGGLVSAGVVLYNKFPNAK